MYIYIIDVALFTCVYIKLYTQIKIGESFVKASEKKQRELKKVEQFSNVS